MAKYQEQPETDQEIRRTSKLWLVAFAALICYVGCNERVDWVAGEIWDEIMEVVRDAGP